MDAVICFNDGYVSRIKVFEALGIKSGYNTERALLIIDNKRIFEAERIVNKVSLEARNKRRRLERGRTLLEESEELGITPSFISRLWQRFQDDGNVSSCYSTGDPRITMPNDDRYLAVTAKRKRRSTASDLSRQLFSATGTTVSRQKVYRRLGHIGLYVRRPVRCVPLTATHCRVRLTWIRDHALWTPQQWSCVMFSTSPGLVCSLIWINMESARYPLSPREHH
ncbi:HTH_Tnp_Tc3_2 domain-containing protein [Trichonephila clavipes]|uniref:HTH_Tnp_Tc3_2 domain-containing protein n=1 Tax=Trichonephila clavipes TaxID=2585209 RepID=A0A8X6VUV2_TRICX|nr:HTH_Tnp_Tc3_2 domain-containing protein [Trichonephila clavipes]